MLIVLCCVELCAACDCDECDSGCAGDAVD
jgi:hypothetical protein